LLNAIPNPSNQSPFSTTKEPLVFVNGRRQPKLKMKAGQTQRWRILNACAQVQVAIQGITSPTGIADTVQWRQSAQDGVQFHYDNYNVPNPLPAIAPANRVDLLVQAPNTPGTYTVPASFFPFPGSGKVTTLMTVEVESPAVTSKPFPGAGDYPKLPDFLKDINPDDIH